MARARASRGPGSTLGTLRATFGASWAAPGPVLVSPAKLWSPQNHTKSMFLHCFVRSALSTPTKPPGAAQVQDRPRSAPGAPRAARRPKKGSPQGPRRPKFGRHEPRKTDQRTPRNHFRNQCSKGLSGPLEARRARGHVPLTIVVERRRSNG